MDFKSGLRYPWGRPVRLWNILWVLLPIFGWFALAGYGKKIINNLVKGSTKELPAFGSFWDNFVTGLLILIKMIPLIIVVGIIGAIPLLGGFISFFVQLLILPWIYINFLEKFTVRSTFEWGTALSVVFSKLGEYLLALIKTIGFSIVYAILSIVLVGIPCLAFGQYFYLADFYASTGKSKASVRKVTVTSKKPVAKKKAAKKKKKSAKKKKR